MPKRNLLLLFLTTAICIVAWMARDRTGHSHRFAEVMATIDRSYFESVDQRELFAASMNGLFAQLDEHSAFISGGQQKEFESLLDLQFGGIGLELSVDPQSHAICVITPVLDSPAWRAGIAAGDFITAIDGRETSGMPFSEVVDRLRGGPGTAVELQLTTVTGEQRSKSQSALPADGASEIQGQRQETRRTLKVVREVVKIESVLGDRRRPDGLWEWLLEGDSEIALIRITSFGDHTLADLQRAIDDIHLQAINSTAGLRGMILDLRGNPGGLLTSAVEVCDLFLENGVIVSTRGRAVAAGTSPPLDVRRATPGSLLAGIPIVVLIDGMTASAGEIIAACLQDNGRAKVVGSRSFGKGTVQSILPVGDGDGLIKLTTSEYLRPSMANIHRRPDADDASVWGVSPDRGCEIVPTGQTLEAVAAWRRVRDTVPVLQTPGTLPVEKVAASPATMLPRNIDPVLSKAMDVLQQHYASSQNASNQ